MGEGIMSSENVRKYLEKFNYQDRIREFEDSTATCEEAARANNCEVGRIGKSISLWIKDKPIIVVAAGDGKISNQKFKGTFHTKAKMISGEDVENVIGHKVGGVCPFVLKDGVEVYLDISIKKYPTTILACGDKNSVVELKIEELEEISNFVSWVDICQNI